MLHGRTWYGVMCLVGASLLAGCSGQGIRVTTSCADDYGPGLDAWVDSMDLDGDNRINSDEFNAAFQSVVDRDDGKMSYSQFANVICNQPVYLGGN